jgi:hypothetical protein
LLRSSGVQEFRSSGVQEFRSSGVQTLPSLTYIVSIKVYSGYCLHSRTPELLYPRTQKKVERKRNFCNEEGKISLKWYYFMPNIVIISEIGRHSANMCNTGDE